MNDSVANISDVGDSLIVLEMCFYGFNLLCGFLAHACVICLIVCRSGGGVAMEVFLLSLSICEIAICLNCFLFILGYWVPHLLGLQLFLTGLTISGRPVFQCLMCVERFLAVVHPLTFLKLKPLRYRIFCCSVAWTFILASCVFCLFTIMQQYRVHLWFLFSQLIIVFSINSFCLVSVLRALKQSGPGERKEEDHRKRRAFHIILVSTVSTVITYLPYLLTALYTVLTGRNKSAYWLPSLVAYGLAGLVQPLLYLRRAGKLSCPTK